MSPDDGTVATPHERPPLLRGHFHTTFRVAAGEGFYCISLTHCGLVMTVMLFAIMASERIEHIQH